MPKQLVTVEFTATPNQAALEATSISLITSTSTLAPSLTPTPTPIRGIFMGDLTLPAGTIAYRPARVTPQPGAAIVAATPALNLAPPAQPTPLPGVQPPLSAPLTAGGTCSIAPAAPFVRAASDANVRAQIGCPRGDALASGLVFQPFERGGMFWRDTREVFALALKAKGAATDSFWRVPDRWDESQPTSDPSLQAPVGLLQPIRGFGLVWRTNPAIKDSLGWAQAGEQQYAALIQFFERGVMFTGVDGSVYALILQDEAPTSIGAHFGVLGQ
ncbi:MAG: hypothetical protein OHK0023_10780 [Anaerolineae bacterium]